MSLLHIAYIEECYAKLDKRVKDINQDYPTLQAYPVSNDLAVRLESNRKLYNAFQLKTETIGEINEIRATLEYSSTVFRSYIQQCEIKNTISCCFAIQGLVDICCEYVNRPIPLRVVSEALCTYFGATCKLPHGHFDCDLDCLKSVLVSIEHLNSKFVILEKIAISNYTLARISGPPSKSTSTCALM